MDQEEKATIPHLLDQRVELPSGREVTFRVAINGMIEEVMVVAVAKALRKEKYSTNALTCLMGAMLSHWKAIDLLFDVKECDTRKLLQLHLACTIRTMFDAYFQAAYIAKEDTEARAKKYLEFQIIEKKLGEHKALKSADGISRYIASSPLRAKGAPRLQKAFDGVKSDYKRGKSSSGDDIKDMRDHWYDGNLGNLASAVGQSGDYLWFAKRYNSAIHSSAAAVTNGFPADDFQLFAVVLMARIARIVTENDGPAISKDSQNVIAALAVDSLAEIGDESESSV